MVLDVIFTNTWIVFSNNDVVQALVDFGAIRCQSLLGCTDLARIRHFVGTSSWYSIVILIKSVPVGTEWFVVSVALSGVKIPSRICNVVLRAWIQDLIRVNTNIVSLRA